MESPNHQQKRLEGYLRGEGNDGEGEGGSDRLGEPAPEETGKSVPPGAEAIVHDPETNDWVSTKQHAKKGGVGTQLVESKEGEDDILPTVPLRRGTCNARPNSTPGAHASGPSNEDFTAAAGNDGGDGTQALDDAETAEESITVIGGAVLVPPGEELVDLETGQAPTSANAPDRPNHQVQRRQESEEVLEATIMQDPSTGSSKYRRHIWAVILLLVVAGIAIIVGVAFGLFGGSDDKNNANNTQEQETKYYPPFSNDLTENVNNQIAEIGSPIYLANKWMTLDPYKTAYTERRLLQRFFLAIIYYYTNGGTWLNKDGWMSYEISECDWWSQTSEDELRGRPRCDENDMILILGLASNNLTGYLPPSATYFPGSPLNELQALDFAHNNISGALPTLDSIKVEYLVVSNNSFDSIFVLGSTRLNDQAATRVLKYDDNRVQSTFYGLMFPFMPNLEIFNVTGNRLDGVVGRQLSYCKNLTYLGMGDNRFGSTLPSQLGLLTNLKEIDVAGNPNLGGSIPSELGALNQLATLDIADTNITGPIPEEVCLLDQEEGGLLEVLANCSQVECCEQ